MKIKQAPLLIKRPPSNKHPFLAVIRGLLIKEIQY